MAAMQRRETQLDHARHAEPPRSEHVICVLFDRAKFTEADAMRWWSATGRALCAN